MQIIQGDESTSNYTIKIKKDIILKSTRGNIYDRNGNVLASNKLIYSIVIEDNGTYKTIREKQLTLNAIAYNLINSVKKNGGILNHDFHVYIDENGCYAFDVDALSLDRFRADVYQKAKIEEMTKEQANATAEDVMEYLCSENRFALYKEGKKVYLKEELKQYDLTDNYTQEEILNMISIRFMLSLNTYKRYLTTTVATDVSEKTVAYIMENKNILQGVDIAEDSIRVYDEGEYFAHVLGYTGKISFKELEELQTQNQIYTDASIIGKAGIEQYMETSLQGINGMEEVYVDKMGKVVKKEEETKVEPIPGKDVYLTIDKDLQIAAYKILEQHIAGILVANISTVKEFDNSQAMDASNIVIPINDVYYALINNNIIDLKHLSSVEASTIEKNVYSKFQLMQKDVIALISEELTKKCSSYKDLNIEMQNYQSYILNDLLTTKLGILLVDAIDKNDETYIAWAKHENISLHEFLSYAIEKGWIDLSKITSDKTYLDSEEAYQALLKEIISQLVIDTSFSKKIYRYMLRDDILSGYEICMLLYEQGVLSKKDMDYKGLVGNKLSAYQWMLNRISNLDITPGQLALDPCSGSVVITQPQTGEVLACVTYPGYDNNRLANQMDSKYYFQLLNDLSLPLYNHATLQTTAPGSTFKPITAIAGLQEHVITPETIIHCDGSFNKVTPNIHCWNRQGHGDVSLIGAIEGSCNDYFNEVSYRLCTDSIGNFSESLGLDKLQKYAKLFDLDKKSGIEITESNPHITDKYAIPSSIGQGTHNYTTVQLARYVSTLANWGMSYNLSILDKITDSKGNVIEDLSPQIQSHVELPTSVWNDIRLGMSEVVESNSILKNIKVSVAAKTGTAQEVKSRPNHALFIGYAPVEEPKIAVAIRIANGYTSGNAVGVAKDIFNYYFNLEDKNSIITGIASKASNNAHTD